MNWFLLFSLLGFSCAIHIAYADRCPNGFHRWNNSCYKIITDASYNWPEAKGLCQSMGADLVTIETSQEDYFLRHWIKQRGIKMNLWINLNDMAVEGHWMSGPERRAAYTGFCNPPSNSGGKEHCVHLSQTTHCWNDNRCAATMGFVCETKD
eukprot:GHVU01079192.1.p1 GENE.GHVU01079192.1~~GHVU01079192.1.p1  ORF type:complete len:152 (+),score=11.29 GHVU01079192.1:107-562(+)